MAPIAVTSAAVTRLHPGQDAQPLRAGASAPSEWSGRRGTTSGKKREVITTLACLPSASPEGRERRTA